MFTTETAFFPIMPKNNDRNFLHKINPNQLKITKITDKISVMSEKTARYQKKKWMLLQEMKEMVTPLVKLKNKFSRPVFSEVVVMMIPQTPHIYTHTVTCYFS